MYVPTNDQTALSNFIRRRHPDYAGMLAHWEFVEATYKGGRSWFVANIHKYLKEGATEFADRIKRAYRFNHTRECVDLVNKYLCKGQVVRNHDDAPAEIQTFWDNVTLSGLDIEQFRALMAKESSIYGRIWVFTDTNKTAEVLSKADEKKAGVRVYAYIVRPQNVLDIGFTETGDLNWILVREVVRDDADPIASSGDVGERFRLWTRDGWFLFKEVDAGRRGKLVQLAGSGAHNLGIVPCFAVDHMIGDNRYTAPGLINDIAYLDRAVANYLSNLDAVIQDQTFSQLVIPAQGISPGTDEYNALTEMGTKRIFTYDGEGGEPKFISPDVKQGQLIVDVVNKIINEIYHTIGLAGERTKQDNAVGIDNSSGVAKAYDFERVNSLLTSKGQAMENAENRLVNLVLAWRGQKPPKEELVKYPETYDVRSLFDEFTIAEKLSLIMAPAGVRREQMAQVVEKLFPRLKADLKAKILQEMQSWPPSLEEITRATTPPSKFDGASEAKPAKENRQGQVTKTTK
jgi:hypothetical protein